MCQSVLYRKDIEKFQKVSVQRLDLEQGHKKTMWRTLLDNEDDDAACFYLDPYIMGPTFSVLIDLTKFDVGDRIAGMAYTIVVQYWADLHTYKLYGPHKFIP